MEGLYLNVAWQFTNMYSPDMTSAMPVRMAISMVSKILHAAASSRKKIRQGKRDKRYEVKIKLLKIVNPQNGHEFTWTPRGWVETKIPKMKDADVERIRQLWNQAVDGSVNKSKAGLLSGKGQPLQMEDLAFDVPNKKG